MKNEIWVEMEFLQHFPQLHAQLELRVVESEGTIQLRRGKVYEIFKINKNAS